MLSLNPEDNEWFDKKPAFCERQQLVTAFTGYPRSGNTWVRTLLEDITKVVTGADDNYTQNLGANIQGQGLMGQFLIGGNAWIQKTHFPMGEPHRSFEFNKALMVIRHPA